MNSINTGDKAAPAAGIGIRDDLRQSIVVMKNELVKFVRGRKILLFLALLALVLGLLTLLPYALGNGLPKDKNTLSVMYLSFVSLIILLSATLFTSTQIVSEFEERTALILFTRPIKRSSIFIGKLLASLIMGAAFLGIYYVATCVVSLAVAGGIDVGIAKSFGIAMLYTFATSGVAIMLGTITKKASTATMLTFFMLMLIFPIVSSVLGASGVDTWWTLDSLSNTITGVLDGYISSRAMIGITVTPIDVGRAVAALAVWGIAFSAVAYALFRKRDF